jgi:hypothetical protein
MKLAPNPQRPRFLRHHRIATLSILAALALLGGPAADALHARRRAADPAQSWDAVYLVCGARAQQRRIRALTRWMEQSPHPPPLILVGNDGQQSLWSSPHQRNLTRAEWGMIALQEWSTHRDDQGTDAPLVRLVPGTFSNTDGEMQALAAALRLAPELRRIAIVTCRFHTRRALRRLDAYAPPGLVIAMVPGTPYWEDRAPWIVAGEYIKLLRDALGYAQTPFLTRPTAD